jgi:hypothetical protein
MIGCAMYAVCICQRTAPEQELMIYTHTPTHFVLPTFTQNKQCMLHCRNKHISYNNDFIPKTHLKKRARRTARCKKNERTSPACARLAYPSTQTMGGV